MKKITFKILSLSILASSFFLTSCNDEDFGADYNKDVYGIYNADYKSLLSGAIMNFGNNGGTASQVYQMTPMLFVQYQSQVLYTTEQNYGDTPGAWGNYYANQLQNLTTIINAYSNSPSQEMLLQGSASNMVGVSKIFRAIILKRVTDLYGDAPFSEANQVNNNIYLPKYDSQEAIYKQLIVDLKSGRDAINTTSTVPTGDILYYGNIARWKKLANSVLLQVTLQLSKKYPGANDFAATEFKSALANPAGVIETVADEAWFTINPSQSYPNPYSAFRAADYRISRELVESLKGTTTGANTVFNRTSNHTQDARLNLYSTTGNATAVGLPYGYDANALANAGFSATASTVSARFRSNNSPISLMTASYTFLNRAEAAALGWTTENIAPLLTSGIVLNYNSLDSKYVTGTAPFTGTAISSSAAAYAAARVADVAAFGAKRVIGEEKWISLFMNGHYSWAEWRRTNFPDLKPAPSALNGGIIPRRIRYPQEEVNFNNANYKTGVQTLLPAEDKNTSKVWWDQ
ncbi:SusD/RagB family nutrient-binding outer membrane lipoprotein [Epilithonimonas ginsengisoli]|uniref:SusD/RagB family nutrient-binding outer membrane lipoprotein n=1 Tax=Epilithonimonas ginsengisoli TaxID=1245592 RepID=A0ABU4JHV6_9FLAO|nr:MULTISPECIES: SusD/RagB family nutrient-binding outer membrane lipoprotein [Chryseobacterium group]MBV6880723.1 SusD/RagB family nutrient-binding outer membrane lipoprotein [Epilithonimonas sp. FP105]MDW8549268.1 SusD/RagB family nutrient-binding outer membrane lipoprotein [Epilithonimonas ginsengisoli]OAH76310.1 hypothetical protein AXA65_01080 [Chryseobacterium sp. FP211-J200]